MSTKIASKKRDENFEEQEDLSLNDCMLRGRVAAMAIEKELPSGDKVVEFRLIVTRIKGQGGRYPRYCSLVGQG